jgi:hypothetical protein
VSSERSPTANKRYAPPPLNAQLAKLAARQHGVVTAEQLAALGLGRPAIAKRVQAGTLHRVHRGVYAVGHAKLSDKGRYMAAVLAAGEGAALAGLSAATLWRAWRRAVPEIHVLAPGRPRRRTGLRVQGARHLDARDVTVHDGIPVTTIARTLVDLTDILTAPQIANVIHEAAFRRRFNAHATRAALARANGRPNLARLEKALAMNEAGSAGTKSDLEDRFVALIQSARLPEPAINEPVDGIEVDFRWPGLVVEVDGSGHARKRTRAEDRRRDRRLASKGYEIVRVPEDELESVVALLTARR